MNSPFILICTAGELFGLVLHIVLKAQTLQRVVPSIKAMLTMDTLFPPSSLRSQGPSNQILCGCPLVLPKSPALYTALPKVKLPPKMPADPFFLWSFPWNSLELLLHLYSNTQHDTFYFFALTLARAHILLAIWINTASQSKIYYSKERSWQNKNHLQEGHSTKDSMIEHSLGKTDYRVLHYHSLVERRD